MNSIAQSVEIIETRILPHLEGLKDTGTHQWQADCPVHGARSKPLGVGIGDNGAVVINCFGGCSKTDVLDALGLSMSDLYPTTETDRRRDNVVAMKRPLARDAVITGGEILPDAESFKEEWNNATEAKPDHAYLARKGVQPHGLRVHDGKLLVQMRTLSGEWRGLQRISPDGDKRFAKGSKPTGACHVLGELSDGGPILIAEGFATAASLREATGYAVAIAFNCGNLLPVAEALRVHFPDARIVVCADDDRRNDKNPGLHKGIVAAEAIGGYLAAPVFEDDKQGTDFNDLAQVAGLEAVAGIVEDALKGEPVSNTVTPLPDLLPVPPLDWEMVPAGPFRRYLQSLHHSDGYNPEYLVAALFSLLGAIIGRQLSIAPLGRHKDWRVFSVLWGMVIGTPSRLKTNPVKAVLRLAKMLRAAAKARSKERQHIYDMAIAEWETKHKALQEMTKEKAKGKRVNVDLEALRVELLESKPEPPAEELYILNDVTEESLSEALAGNPHGVLAYRDELSGLMQSLTKDYNRGLKQFLLECWTGSGTYTVKRKGKPAIHISGLAAGVFGTIQPDKVRDLLSEQDNTADGFLARFQFSVWADATTRGDFEAEVDREAERECASRICDLADLDYRKHGADIDGDDDKPPVLTFDKEAQRLFIDWLDGLERRLNSGTLGAREEEFLGKYRSLVPSIALVLHVAEGQRGKISADTLGRAIAMAAWLEAHLQRILYYGKQTPAHSLLGHIEAGKLGDTFTLRDVKQKNWAGLKDDEIVQEAIDTLERHGYIRAGENQSGPAGGRPTTRYAVRVATSKNEAAA